MISTNTFSKPTDEKMTLWYKLPRIVYATQYMQYILQHTHTHLTALCQGLPGQAGTRKVTIWMLMKQETVSGSNISQGIRKSAPSSRQTTTSAPPPHSFFTGMPFLPPNQSKHWRHHILHITCWSVNRTVSISNIYYNTHAHTHARTHTHTHPFNGPLSRTTQVSR